LPKYLKTLAYAFPASLARLKSYVKVANRFINGSAFRPDTYSSLLALFVYLTSILPLSIWVDLCQQDVEVSII